MDLPPLLGQGKRQAFEDINYYLRVVETIEILIIQCKSKTVEWDSFKDLKLFNQLFWLHEHVKYCSIYNIYPIH